LCSSATIFAQSASLDTHWIGESGLGSDLLLILPTVSPISLADQLVNLLRGEHAALLRALDGQAGPLLQADQDPGAGAEACAHGQGEETAHRAANDQEDDCD